MTDVCKICKINLLSILALPVLLVSIVSKILQTAMEKALVFLGVGAAIFGLYLLNEFFNRPDSFLDTLGFFAAILILFGAIFGLVLGVILLFGGIAAAALAVVATLWMTAFGTIFELSHEGYSKLYGICQTDFEPLARTAAPSRFLCIFWYLLKALNTAITTLFLFAFPISCVAAAGFGAYCIFYVHRSVSQSFGIGIFSYLKLFPITNIVFSVLNFLVFVIATGVVIVSLGIEWGEWGETLKYGTKSYGTRRKNQRTFESTYWSDAEIESGKRLQRCEHTMQSLNELLENMDTLQQQVDTVLHIAPDSTLGYTFAEYMTLLANITKELSASPNGVPHDEFERRFIPQIDKAKKQFAHIQKDVFQILNEELSGGARRNNEMDFFVGCRTKEEIRQRYKALSKAYHPDAGGDTETFQTLQNQYQEKMAQ